MVAALQPGDQAVPSLLPLSSQTWASLGGAIANEMSRMTLIAPVVEVGEALPSVGNAAGCLCGPGTVWEGGRTSCL